MSTDSVEVTEVEIAIIGAGFSGIAMAIALRRDGHEDVVLLERAAGLGGTWRDNTYPGCACDVPSVLYSLRDAPNPEWTRGWALQPEILAYAREVARRHDIDRLIRYEHEVTEAAWSNDHGRWEIATTGGRYRAEILISAVGQLADPKIPDLPGLDGFAGASFHSARWDHDHRLEGRRVAVIGTGASAIQFVPEIQPRVARLTVFQRTPAWVLPRDNPSISAGLRRRFARHPWLLRAARGLVFRLLESTHFCFGHPRGMALSEAVGRWQIARQVRDRDLRARLIPGFSLGCKRVLFSNRWYPAITAPNAEVVSAGIREVVPDGIVDADGRHHAVDTIILGTGFHVTDPPIAERLRGRTGETLAGAWQGSPRAHLGIAVPAFPNLFLLLGPNTGLGHNSVLLMVEAQIAYLRQLLAHRARQGNGAIEPTPEAHARYLDEIAAGNAGSVWTAGGCASWYLDRTGRQSALWPLSVRAYERRIARFAPGDYAVAAPRQPVAAALV